MLTRDDAQGLTDALSAVALVAYAASALRRSVRSPLEARLVLSFTALAVFFAVRGAAEVFDRPALRDAVQFIAPLLPVTGLFLAEGLLRRHAPFWLKLAIPAGAVATCIALAVSGGDSAVSTWGLGGYVALSLLALTVFVLARDRSSLSFQENATVGGFLAAGAGLLLLSITDFAPQAPLGMSGLGAAGLAFMATVKPTSVRDAQRSMLDLGVLVLLGAVFTLGLAAALSMPMDVETARLGVVMFALIFAATTILRALQSGAQSVWGLRRALVAADLSGLTRFLDDVAGQPALKDLRIAGDAHLADYDPEKLLTTLRTRPVWTRSMLGDALDGGAEELADLMARTDATCAGLISERPLRVGLLTLPEIGGEDQEIDFALFCKLTVKAAEENS